jgi:hypothetical protein
MFNVVTIATKNYFPYTQLLFASLQNSENDFHLTVFVMNRRRSPGSPATDDAPFASYRRSDGLA